MKIFFTGIADMLDEPTSDEKEKELINKFNVLNFVVIQIEKTEETKVFYNGIAYFDTYVNVMDLLLSIRGDGYIINVLNK